MAKTNTLAAASFLLVFSRAWTQLANLVLLLAAARVLSPAEFGAFSLVSITVLILVQTADSGWYEYLSKVPTDEELPPEVLTCAVASGVMGVAISCVIAWLIFVLSGSYTYSYLMLALSALPLIISIVSVQNGVHTQRGHIIKIPLSVIPAEAIGLAISIYGLSVGWGVFALAAHKLITAIISLLIVALWNGWFVPLSWRLARLKEVILFWWHLFLIRVSGFFQNFGGDYLIGALIDLAGVGIYRAANRLAGAVGEMINEPARMIAWSILPKKNGEEESSSGKNLDLLIVGVMAVALPAFIGLVALNNELIALLLGPGWQAAAPVLTFLSFERMLNVLIPLFTPVMSIERAESRLPRMMFFLTVLTLTFMAAIGWMGVVHAAGARLFASLAIIPLSITVFAKYGNMNLKPVSVDIFKLTIAGAIMWIVVEVLKSQEVMMQLPLIASVAISVLIGAVVYTLSVLVLRPSPVSAYFKKRRTA